MIFRLAPEGLVGVLKSLWRKGGAASPASRRESGGADVEVVPVDKATGREVSLVVDEALPGSSTFLAGE